MAEEQRDLISDHGSSVFRARDTQRSALGSKAALSTLSILVALLIAGQAVTVYFVYQQNGQIGKLTKTSQTLQLEALQRKLPASAKPAKGAKIAIMSMPLRVPSLDPTADVAMAPASNKTEDQVKHLLLQTDPRKKFPELKYNMMADNLKTLKTTMTDAEWKSFESWMHKWLLFEMAKNTKPKGRKTTAAKKVQTKCQAEASSGGVQPGHFQPQCDENGDYLPKQCNASTGYCWCSYKNGTRIEGTATREKLDCPDDAAVTTPATTAEPEMIFSGSEAVKLAV